MKRSRKLLPLCVVIPLVACRAPTEEPIGPLRVADAGPTVSAVTTGFEDTVVGPVVVDGVSFTLRIPAVAIEPGVEITMTPVTLGDAPFETYGAFRFGPTGTTFRVPATLRAEGLPGGAVPGSALLDDEGRGATLAFVPHEGGVAEAAVEHFSIASIVEVGTAEAAVAAAGLADVPTDPLEAAPALARAFNETLLPAISAADDSLTDFAFAQRLLGEWGAAAQGRGLGGSPFSGLGGRTFGQAAADAAEELVAAGQRLLADLSQPRCIDGTGRLSHPFDWFGALGHITSSLRLLGGDAAVPASFAPCLTLELTPAVLTQGGAIERAQRFVQVFVGIDATSPNGVKAPMPGSYKLEVSGATGADGASDIFFDAPSPALAPVDLDRGADCEARSSTIDVALTGALKDTLGLTNLELAPVVATLSYSDEGTECCAAPGQGNLTLFAEDSCGQEPRISFGFGGSHTLAVLGDGTAWAWGLGSSGQLGVGTLDHHFSPVQITALTDVVAVAAGPTNSLALRADGTVWAWGFSANGALGDGDLSPHMALTPVQVPGLTDVIDISAEDGRCLAIKADGTVWQWGIIGFDPAGFSVGSATPSQVPGLADVIAVGSSFLHVLALKADGTVVAWGINETGQLGDGTTLDSETPVEVVGLTDVIAIHVLSHVSSIALRADGTVWGWGRNVFGDGATPLVPTQLTLPGLADVIAITGGTPTALPTYLALRADGKILAWGGNFYGGVGDGTTEDRLTPIEIVGLNDVIAIHSGGLISFAMTSDGSLWAWGQETFLGCGEGLPLFNPLPLDVLPPF